jgi:excinuclease UvrABC nuclease subunit
MIEINFDEWVSSEFGPTEKPGVYAVCQCDWFKKGSEEVVYIGSAKNIQKRVLNTAHPYRKLLNIVTWPVTVYVKYFETPDYVELEKAAIRKFRPKYNTTYNGETIH